MNWIYLGLVQAIIEEFEKLMSVTASAEKHQEQRHTNFLVLTLVEHPNDIYVVRDQSLVHTAEIEHEGYCAHTDLDVNLIP